MILRRFVFFIALAVAFFLNSCYKAPELTLEEIAELTESSGEKLLEKTLYKPYKNQKFVSGKIGLSWYDSIMGDPKTFNQLIAERDAQSAGILEATLDYLVDYDPIERQWKPHAAFFEIETNEKNDTLIVHYTLRDDIFWTYYDSNKKIPVTSDDFVFWYNEIAGDPVFESSGYAQQLVTMKDGSEGHIDCVKIDDKHFDFIFPRIVADPLLATNMSCCPSFLYKKAKDEGGADGVKSLFAANVNLKTLPSCGKWYITEYTQALRLVLKRNPNYWEKDEAGNSIPFMNEQILQIVGDMNTEYLLFRQGKLESYVSAPENVSDLIENQKDDYTVFRADGSMGSSLWSFNQNSKNSTADFYRWFCKKQFRQAMSCILNRERIISQTYRGLAEPMYYFFPPANPYYNNEITLQYRYNLNQAQTLLESIGFYRDGEGVMFDCDGVRVEFDLTIPSSNNVFNDIAQIITDEASKIGIKINVRQLDFQKIIEMLTSTYDWQSIMIGLGSNMFPSQGSNVWPSYGNLHLWNPLQKSPETDWEARIDYLYNEGCFTIEKNAAKKIWDEYQRIILDECPIIYLVRNRSIWALRNKWDMTNVYYDNLNGAETNWVFMREY